MNTVGPTELRFRCEMARFTKTLVGTRNPSGYLDLEVHLPEAGFSTSGLLAIWCVIFVGLADNAIRPLAIGATSKIPVPAIVLGAICGVFAMGALGLILGPVAFAILITVWRDVTETDQTKGLAGDRLEPPA